MVVGSYVTSGGDTHFFLYNPTGNTFTDPFKNQSGIDYYGIAINNDGQIAGTQTTGSLSHGFYYDPSTGHFVDLNSLLGPSGNSSATSINGSGQVAGNSDYSGNIVHAFLSAAHGGALTDLGTIGSGSSYAEGVNDNGYVVGYYDTSEGTRAFLWNGTETVDLNSLIPSGSGLTLIQANSINNLGQIVGNALDSDGNIHAFLLNPVTVPEPSTLTLGLMGGAMGLLGWLRCRRRRNG